MEQAALFDMDRTLIRKDSASLYVKYQRSKGHAKKRDVVRVGWWLLQYTLGVIDAERVAEQAMESFRGKTERWLRSSCEEMYEQFVRPHVSEAGRAAVKLHQDKGHVVAIVTSATDYAARPLARELGIDHIVCTRLEVEDGRFTGKVIQPMCYGPGKIEHARRVGEELGYDLTQATFYSDSITDLPLLEHVREPIVVNPDTRLRRIAKKRGWPVRSW